MTITAAFDRRPALGIALAVAAGSALSAMRPPAAISAAVLVVAFALACAFAVRGRASTVRAARWAAAMLVVCSAWFAWGSHLAGVRAKAMDAVFGDADSARLEVEGVVGSDIEVSSLKNGGIRCYFTLCDISASADGVSPSSAHLARHGAPPVRVVWFGHRPKEGDDRPVPRAGDRWLFRGKAEPKGRILARRTIELNSGNDRSALVAPAARGDFRSLVAAMRAECSRRLALGMKGHRDESAMAQAIILGYRNDVPYRLNRMFRDSGTMHVFAISGMHVMIVAGFMAFLLGPLGIPRTRWFMVVCPALVAYTVATGAQPSAMRACLMTCLYLAAPLFGRRPDGPSALSLAAIVLLAWDPAQIANAGFLLSFTVVAGLIALATPLCRLFRRLPFAVRLEEDEHALWKLGGEVDGFRLWSARAKLVAYRYVADLLGVSVVAWIASAPLTAWYFERLSPCAILANLAIVPLAFVVVVGGCTGMVAASVSGFLGAAVNQVVLAATSLMAWVAGLASSVPWLVCKVPKPPEWFIALWYLAFAMLAWRIRSRDVSDDPNPLPY